jgi:hypothetical protein
MFSFPPKELNGFKPLCQLLAYPGVPADWINPGTRQELRIECLFPADDLTESHHPIRPT